MKLGSSRGMDTKPPPRSERSKPRHELRLTRRSQPPYPWPPEQAQPVVSKPCRTTPLVDDLKAYMREQAAKLSRGHDLVKAIHYMLKRWHAFTLFLDDGRVCMSNNAAERGLRCVALGRKSWLFCGSDRGGRR